MCLAVSEKQSSLYSRSHLITTEKVRGLNSDFCGREQDNGTTGGGEKCKAGIADEVMATHEGVGKLMFVQKLFIHSQKQEN